jgi:hypothetical protein
MKTTALILRNPYLDTLFDAQLLCEVCGEVPWTQTARYCLARICAGCAEGEPGPDE